MKVTLTYLGRIVSMVPAELGRQFHDACTVRVLKSEAACAENGWQERKWTEDKALYWYDTLPDGTPVFCAFSGYGYRFQYALTQQGHEVVIKDNVPCGLPERPDITVLKGIQWRGSQGTVMAKLLANRMGLIDCPTGWGKSFIIRQLAAVYPKAKIAVNVPSSKVAKELYAELVKVDPNNVGMVGGGRNRTKKRIMVAVTHSLHRLDPETNLLLTDEAHATLTENFIEKFGLFYRARFFAFTATPEGRHDKADGFMEAMFGPVLHHVPYQEAVETGNVAQIRFRIYQLTSGPKTVGFSKARRDREGLWRNTIRNDAIAKVARQLDKELGSDAQILIMTTTAEHCYLLQQLLPEYVVAAGEITEEREEELRLKGSMVEGQVATTDKQLDEYKEQFSSGAIKRAISTMVWSKGVNFLDLAALIRADGTASEIGSGQIPGRLSRKGSDGQKELGLLIDFNDRFCPSLANRSRERIKVYRKNGWEYEQGV